MPDQIAVATSDDDYAAFGDLIREYWQWIRHRYVDLPGMIDQVGSHQSLDADLNSLSRTYGPPAGNDRRCLRADPIVK